MGSLSWAMLRKHVPGYAGAFAAMVLAAALMGGSLSLTFAARSLDGVDPAAFSPEQWAGVTQYAGFMQMIGGTTAFVAILVSSILIASLVSFVVAGRRRELAMLRLTGARPGQIVRMVTGEVALLSAAASVVGVALATGVGGAYLALFSSTYTTVPGLFVGVHPEAMLAGALLTVLVAVAAAVGPARTGGRVAPIEALQEGSSRRKPMTAKRWIVGGLAVAGALALLLVPAGLDLSVFTMLVMLQGFLAIIGLVQLAPVIVAPVSRLVCGLVARVAPGPGTLAQGHASWNAARTASLANPALLLVAVPAVFLVTTFGLTEGLSVLSLRTLHADAVATQPAGDARADVAAVSAIDGVAAASPAFITASEFYEQTPLMLEAHQLHLVDFDSLATMVDLDVVAGDLAAVEGTHIAAIQNSDRHVGDVLSLKGPSGTMDLTIVATVDNVPGSRELLADLATFDTRGVTTEHREWFLDLADGVTPQDVAGPVSAALAPDAPESVRVDSSADFVKRLDRESNQQVMTSVLIMIGGACLLAALAIAVSQVTGLRERRAEFALSRRAGGQPGAIQASTLIETLAVLVIAFTLALAVVGLVWARVWQNFQAQGIGALPPVPWDILGAFALVGTVIALVSAVAGTRWALRAIRAA